MATTTIPQYSGSVSADTNSTPNTIPMRDNSAGLYATTIQGTALVSTGELVIPVSTKTASFTADATATYYLVDATSAAVTITLPSASANAGQIYFFTRKDSVTAHAITLATPLGTTSLTSQYQRVTVVSDGTSWFSN